jgi:hypothetical protein
MVIYMKDERCISCSAHDDMWCKDGMGTIDCHIPHIVRREFYKWHTIRDPETKQVRPITLEEWNALPDGTGVDW